MKNTILTAVFTKEDFSKANAWEDLQFERGFNVVATLRGNGLIVKIASMKQLTHQERVNIADACIA